MNSNTNKLKKSKAPSRGRKAGSCRREGNATGRLARREGLPRPEARVEGISGLVGWLALRGEATLLEGSHGGNWWPCWAAHVEGRGAVSRELSRREGAQRQQLRQWGELQRAEWRKRAVAL